MRLLVLGASGGTGREVVAQALARDMVVTAFVRDPARLRAQHSKLNIVRGNVADYMRIAEAVAGQDAVISTLGVGEPLKHDPVVIEGIRNVLRAMEQHGVQRLVYQSFIGVRESRAAAGFVVKYIAKIPLRHEISDHEVKEALVRASPLKWTIVRPPKLTNGPRTGRYRSGDDISARSLFPMLSRADVADFMLSQLTDTAYVRRAPSVLP